MPSYIQNSFSTGEWAKEFWGRTDHDGYRHGLRHARNFQIMPGGGATFRAGSRRAAAAKSSAADTGKPRLIAFGPSNNTNYTIEIGDTYARFFRKQAAVLNAGVPFEVVLPYSYGDLAKLGFSKSGPPNTASMLWLWHQQYAPRQLQWNGGGTPDISWVVQQAGFTDGPYLDQIGGTTTATPSAAGGASATITLNNTTEVNGGAGFLASDVGRCVRFLCPTWTLVALPLPGTPGTGYHVSDTITLTTTGSPGPLLTATAGVDRAAVITVTQINGTGGVTGAVITDPGQYLGQPTTTLGQARSNGNGAGVAGLSTWSQSGEPVWLWGTITSVADTTHCNVTLGNLTLDAAGTVTQPGAFISTAAITSWRLGAWCGFEGFPSCGAVFQGRKIAGGQSGKPRRVWGSESGKFLSMAPSLATGQVVASNAFAYDLDNDGQSDIITWISPAGSAQVPQLAVGTASAEFIIQPASAGAALGPLNVQSYLETRYGAARAQPLRIGRVLHFIDHSLQRLRAWAYQWSAQGFTGPEAQPYGKHLSAQGLGEIAYALNPYSTVWSTTKDGQLAGLTWQSDEREPLHNIAAWHSHPLGGTWYGGPALVESLAVSAAEDGSYDEIWLSVLRNDSGAVSRTIEFLSLPFQTTPIFGKPVLSGACFLDCAISSPLTYPAALCTPTFTPITNADGTVQTFPARGDSVLFGFSADVALAGDLSPGTVLRINTGTFRLTLVSDARNVFCQCLDPPTSLQPQPANGWSYTKMTTSFSGFAALAGRTIGIIGDGSDQGTQTLFGDTITTAEPASLITAGLPYTGELETLDLDLPAPDGSSQGKTGRLDHLYLRVFDSLGGEYGPAPDEDNPNPKLDAIEPRQDSDLLGWAPDLMSGDLRLPFPGGSSQHRRVRVRQTRPWPMTVLAIVAKGGTQEIAPR